MSGTSIRTPDQRLRVFVSSTLGELAEERLAVREAIERLQLTPVMFELGARPHPPRELYRAYLEQSQIFVGVYWQRYGWVAPGETVSGLEDEYILSEGLPRLLYVKAPAQSREPALHQLLERVKADDTASYKPFRTAQELAGLVSGDLALLLSERFVTAGGSSVAEATPRAPRRHNLPAQLTSFVGREDQLRALKESLAQSRLVTLTGIGGSGKSRLAVQAAGDLVEKHPDGAWLVELAPLTDPARVPSAVARALGVPEESRRALVDTLIEQLRPRNLLLVLDNCEHLLTATAELAAALLTAAPDLRVLATSREGLGIPGEVVLPVPSLAVPVVGAEPGTFTDSPAVRLFAERARAVRPDFTVTPGNSDIVVEIVRRLDGIPLALELAAARTKVLSVEQIATRLSDRFRLLSGGLRTALPRQQTLRAAMDWSYDLLDDAERAVLRRLSIFRGGWTVEAAETVCSGNRVDVLDVLDVLGRLVDKSLVLVVTGKAENRYRLLETVRQYGQERLLDAGESEVHHDRHRDWCSSLLQAAGEHIRGGSGQVDWLERLEAEHGNVLAALEWTWSLGDADAALRIAVGTTWFWHLRGYWDEARRSLEQSLALPGGDPSLRGEAGAWAAIFAWRRGDLDRAEELAEDSAARVAGSGWDSEGLALLALALVAISRAAHEQARGHAQRALTVFRAQDNTWGVTTALIVLSHIAMNTGSSEVPDLLRTSASWLMSGTDMWGQAHVLTLQGMQALRGLDLDGARELHTESHAITARLGDRAGQAENLLALGHNHLLRGENDEAARALDASRSLVEELHDAHQAAHVDQARALLAAARGDVAERERLLDDVRRRLLAMGRAAMGSTYALGMADLYRRGDRPELAAAMLRHALSMLDETRAQESYQRATEQLAALQTPLTGTTARPHPDSS